MGPDGVAWRKRHRHLDRLSMVSAGKMALQDAQIKNDTDFLRLSPERVGIASTAYGSLDAITNSTESANSKIRDTSIRRASRIQSSTRLPVT
ncbi:MAG: hypothetical protein R3A47_01925 [Polyangiales bacterium]